MTAKRRGRGKAFTIRRGVENQYAVVWLAGTDGQVSSTDWIWHNRLVGLTGLSLKPGESVRVKLVTVVRPRKAKQ